MNDQTKPTQILILGGPHLDSSTPTSFLSNTIQHLTNWKPDAIAIELLSGELVTLYQKLDKNYQQLSVGNMPQAVALAQEAKKYRSWTLSEAQQKAQQTDTSPTERVLAYLIAKEPINALLYWTTELALPAPLQDMLASYAQSPSEIHRIALPIAQKLNHQQLYHIDDHTGLDIYFKFKEELKSFWADLIMPNFKPYDQTLQQSKLEQDLWPIFKLMNSPEYLAWSYKTEVGTYLNNPLPNHAHQARIAQWDARNLFMTARLRRVTAFHAGKRVLALVGASHKEPLEQAISSLAPDIQIINFEDIG